MRLDSGNTIRGKVGGGGGGGGGVRIRGSHKERETLNIYHASEVLD